jgi:hypothetical protein
MNQNQLNFQSQNLVVDWISFKFQHLSSSRKIDIANYLNQNINIFINKNINKNFVDI